MVNRDATLDISKKEAAIRYDTVTREKMSENDRRVMAELIGAAGEKGYHIQYYFQLGFLDLQCRDLFPVIRDHVWRFDDPEFSIRLLSYLGVPKLYEATPFLIESFKKVKRRRLGCPRSPETTRSAAAGALLRIKDGKFQETYRALVTERDTHDDAGFLVELLGYFDSPVNYSFLLALLSDENVNIQIPAIRALGRFKAYAAPLAAILYDIEINAANRDIARAARESRQKLQKGGRKHTDGKADQFLSG